MIRPLLSEIYSLLTAKPVVICPECEQDEMLRRNTGYANWWCWNCQEFRDNADYEIR